MIEFDCQLNNLLRKGYPEAAGVTGREFSMGVKPLQPGLAGLASLKWIWRKGRSRS